jgi:hypothetical protein
MGIGMPAAHPDSAIHYIERAKRLRIAASTTDQDDTRSQLLTAAQDYEEFAEAVEVRNRHRYGE